jgi:hypothetical protein
MNRTKMQINTKLAQEQKLSEMNNGHTYMFIQAWQRQIQHHFSWKQAIERESNKTSYEHQSLKPSYSSNT